MLLKTLESPLDCKQSFGLWSIPKEVSPEYSLERLMLKLKLQYFDHLIHWKRPWYWERLKAGEGDDRGWDGWMASLSWWTWVWADSWSWWRTRKPGVLQSMGSQESDMTEQLNWIHSIDGKMNAQRGSWACLELFQQAVELVFEPKKSASRTPDF